MKDFLEALIKGMKQSISLRSLIKKEALEKFNNDTEVLVANLIEKEISEGNVGDFLNSFLPSKDIDRILTEVPSLTILVPELPMESFSANIWNEHIQLPAVAIRTVIANDNPFFEFLEDGTLMTDVIPENLIPADPILVVKENERVTSSINTDFKNATGREFYTSKKTSVIYKFTHEVFDGRLFPVKIIPEFSNIDNHIAQSYHLTNNQSAWQRDYIYYDIHPAAQNGPYNYKFKEFLTYLKPREYNGSAKGAYTKMSQQVTGDPSYYQVSSASNNFNSWTDGAFEIVFDFKVNYSFDTGGESINVPVTAMPENIFELTYRHYTKSHYVFWKKNYFEVTSIKSKKMHLDLPILNWDLKNYATTMKVDLFEFDQDIEVNISQTIKSKAAINFSADLAGLSVGEVAKLGIKFGASGEKETTNTYSTKTTYSSNNLGNTIVDFKEPVINGYLSGTSNFFTINHYIIATQTTPDIEFCVMPKRIQN